MTKFIANINVKNRIVTEEVESNNIEEARRYFDNFVPYWGKVWFDWQYAYIVSVSEKKII